MIDVDMMLRRRLLRVYPSSPMLMTLMLFGHVHPPMYTHILLTPRLTYVNRTLRSCAHYIVYRYHAPIKHIIEHTLSNKHTK